MLQRYYSMIFQILTVAVIQYSNRFPPEYDKFIAKNGEKKLLQLELIQTFKLLAVHTSVK